MSLPQSYFQPALPFLNQSAIVNEGTSLGLAAFWRCANLLANNVAAMSPMQMFLGDELQPTPDIAINPCSTYFTSQYWHEATITLLMAGNWIGVIQRDPNGLVQQVIPVKPEFCNVHYQQNGTYYYSMVNPTIGKRQNYKPEDILHVRLVTQPQRVEGIGIVAAHVRGLSLAMDTMLASSLAFRGNGVPSVGLQVAATLSQEATDELKREWVRKTTEEPGVPMVTNPGMEIINLNQHKPRDMETLASRAQAAVEICWMFGLNPSELGIAASTGSNEMAYSNATDRKSARFLDAVGPITRRFEDAFSTLVPGDLKFNTAALTAMSPKEAADVDLVVAQTEAIRAGMTTQVAA